MRKMKLDNRLVLLKDSGQIDEEVFDKTLKVIDLFQSELNIILTEENGAMLITHFSIAFQRMKNKKNIDNVDEETALQVRKDKNYIAAEKIIKEVEKIINIDICENEKIFLALHVCALLENDNTNA
jgi:transcriptional regulatory protein LevR